MKFNLKRNEYKTTFLKTQEGVSFYSCEPWKDYYYYYCFFFFFFLGGGGGGYSLIKAIHVHTCSHVLDTLGMYSFRGLGGRGGGWVRLSLIAYV